jgi:hypothetical protein
MLCVDILTYWVSLDCTNYTFLLLRLTSIRALFRDITSGAVTRIGSGAAVVLPSGQTTPLEKNTVRDIRNGRIDSF